MIRVDVSTLSWGTVQDAQGNARPGLPWTLVNAGTGATVLSGLTDGNGQLTGLAPEGRYTLTVGGVVKTVHVTSSKYALEIDALWNPVGGRMDNFDRGAADATFTLQNGILRITGGLVVREGEKYTGIGFFAGAVALAGGTHQWCCLIDAYTEDVLCYTTDYTSTAWNANAPRTLGIAAGGYTADQDRAVWAGIMITASTMPSVSARAQPSGGLGTVNAVPWLGGSADSGLTGPVIPGNNITLSGVPGPQIYAYLA